MKPDVSEDEIRAVFTTDGGVLASQLHESICEGLDKDKATQIDPLVKKLAPEDHPLRSNEFKGWDQVIKEWAEKKWPDLKALKDAGTPHFQRTRHAVRWWLEDVFPELNPTPVGGSSLVPGTTRSGVPNSTMGPGHDPIAGRRTKTKEYGENLAAAWGWTVPGVVDVQKVGDYVPKLGYDVQVILKDGRQLHIEAKATAGSGDVVALTEGERHHVQDSRCKHEHVLFVVSDIECRNVNGEWQCWGGTQWAVPHWNIATSDLTEQPAWLYRVPLIATIQIHGAEHRS